MGRKSSAKGKNQARPAQGQQQAQIRKQGFNPLLIGVLAVAVIAAGALVMRGSSGTSESGATTETQDTAEATAERAARAAAIAAVGPHEQATLPPIPFGAFAPPRPMDMITEAYQFAAEHPEILSYVPCFCGCERAGHEGSHDCFVRARNENGDVIAWDEHGVECTVCVDVANRARQLYTSGASVTDIHAAIEKEFAPVYPGHTPTPAPPSAND